MPVERERDRDVFLNPRAFGDIVVFADGHCAFGIFNNDGAYVLDDGGRARMVSQHPTVLVKTSDAEGQEIGAPIKVANRPYTTNTKLAVEDGAFTRIELQRAATYA